MILDHAYIPTKYHSRFGLIGRFCTELIEAMQLAGVKVNQDLPDGHDAAVFFFNSFGLSALSEQRERLAGPGRTTPIVQWIIDHPLAFDAAALDGWFELPAYRLATVCDDDLQLLRLRWPKLRAARVYHGVWPGALANPASLPATHAGQAFPAASTTPHTTDISTAPPRDIDVLVAGSIATDAELIKLTHALPASLHTVAHEIAHLRAEQPHITIAQAMDLCLPVGIYAPDHWELLGRLQLLSVAILNIRRRVQLITALQGLHVTVLGGENWAPHCTGTVTYAGQADFADMHRWIKRAKVCVALNPPQFATGFSERLLLSMAGGAATVTDDRPAVRAEFCTPAPAGTRFSGTNSPFLRLFHAARPQEARALCEQLLADHPARVAMADAAVRAVAAGHLWAHRLPQLFGAATHAVRNP